MCFPSLIKHSFVGGVTSFIKLIVSDKTRSICATTWRLLSLSPPPLPHIYIFTHTHTSVCAFVWRWGNTTCYIFYL